jgi:hypothetical protein
MREIKKDVLTTKVVWGVNKNYEYELSRNVRDGLGFGGEKETLNDFFASEAHVTYQINFIILHSFASTMEPFYAKIVAAATGSTLTALTSAYLPHY